MIEEAQERAYELAHAAVVAATDGDRLGMEALCKVFVVELEMILKAARQSPPDTA